MDWILFGPPGCGKGTQAERLSGGMNLYHFSTGEVLRENVKNGTELGQKADAIMKSGALVPDDVIIDMVSAKLSEDAVKATTGVLFDGFPRTIPQAEALESALTALGRELGGVLSLTVAEEELIDRLSKRGRADDTLDTIKNRLQVYEDQTAPLIGFYKERGQLFEVEGMGTMEEIEGRLREVIAKRQG